LYLKRERKRHTEIKISERNSGRKKEREKEED
jgi:hypothetical protein